MSAPQRSRASALPHIATSPDQIPNPVGSLPDTAIKSLYLRGSDDPLHLLTHDQEKNFLVTLFCWRSPILTVGALICTNLIALLVTVFHFNLITLVCYIIAVQIILSLTYIRLTKLYLNFHGASPTTREITQYEGPYYSREEIQATVNFICTYIFALFDQMILVYRGINTAKSVTTIIILFVIAQLARLLPLALLVAWAITGTAIVMLFRTHPQFKLKWYELMLSIFTLDQEDPPTCEPHHNRSFPGPAPGSGPQPHHHHHHHHHHHDPSHSLSHHISPAPTPTSPASAAVAMRLSHHISNNPGYVQYGHSPQLPLQTPHGGAIHNAAPLYTTATVQTTSAPANRSQHTRQVGPDVIPPR